VWTEGRELLFTSTVHWLNRDGEEEEEGERERGRTTWGDCDPAEDDGVLLVFAVVELLAGGRAGWKKEKKICRGRGTGGRGGYSSTSVDLGSQGGCTAICWRRRKVSVGSSGAEDTVEREGRRNVLQRRERHSRWLITDAMVAGQWSWQSLLVLVAHGGAGGRNGDGAGFLWRRKKEEETEEENLQCGEGGRLVF